MSLFFFFQAEDGIRYWSVTGVQTCALPIYDQHRFAAGGRSAFWRSSRWLRGRRDAWQVDLEARAMPGLGIHGDVAAALFHDAVHRGEPESRALADFLGREERLRGGGAGRGIPPPPGIPPRGAGKRTRGPA